MAWIMANIWTIAVALVLIAIVTFIIIKMVKDKKKGVSSCRCGCSSCPINGTCNKDEKK